MIQNLLHQTKDTLENTLCSTSPFSLGFLEAAVGNRSSGFWKSHFGWRRSPRCLLKVLGVGWGANCLFERV